MEIIKAIRKSNNMTQQELADAIGVNRATISKYESGSIDPTYGQLREIARALKVPLEHLIEREETRRTNSCLELLVDNLTNTITPYIEYAAELDVEKEKELQYGEDYLYEVNQSAVYAMATKSIERLGEDLEARFPIHKNEK